MTSKTVVLRRAAPKGGGKYDGLVRPDGRIHRRLFTDPQIFEEEMSKIFGATWVFLAHEGELPKPNDFKTTTLGRRPVIVTRGSNGDLHALLNRCTHRGSLVCIEHQGNAKQFQCPFHHWTFGNNGELLGLPYPKGQGPNFDRKANGLGKLPRLESYRGYIFGSLNPEVEPLVEWLGPARAILDWSIDKEKIGSGGVTVVKGTHHTVNGNWKLQYENVSDGYHAAFLHRSMVEMTKQRHGPGRGLEHWRAGDRSPMYDQYLGRGHKFMDQRPSNPSPWQSARPVPGREAFSTALIGRLGEAGAADQLELSARAYINLTLYPNLFIMGHGQYAVYEPVAVDCTNIKFYTVIPDSLPEEVKRLRVRFVEDFNTMGLPDDNEALERIQESLTTIPEMEWLNYERGLATEKVGEDGVITGSAMEETSQRRTYSHWQTLMNREVRLQVA